MTTGAQVYMLTSRNVLMPGTLVGETTGRSGHPLLEVESPNGKIYTTAPANVYDEQTGRIMLAHARAEQMAAQGYQIAVRNDGTYRIFQPAKHGVTGGYIVKVIDGATSCECPAHEATPGCCKHCQAVCSLLWNKAHLAEVRGWRPGQVRYERLATQIAGETMAAETSAERRARLKESMKRDF